MEILLITYTFGIIMLMLVLCNFGLPDSVKLEGKLNKLPDNISELKRMREIKLRAWDEKESYMAYQGTVDLETIESFIFHWGNEKLMEFTGLNDWWEYDILDNEDGRWIVVFDEGCFCAKLIGGNSKKHITLRDLCGAVKIGNYFENPDLLKTNGGNFE